ncbi:MAG: hypothetical protein JSW73_01200 [Candidatus Woesearchaeota archaeon]|nr:MAG: hypothetical protein JSW73_01200 [Candidatus Woesearchaeota archaeon]
MKTETKLHINNAGRGASFLVATYGYLRGTGEYFIQLSQNILATASYFILTGRSKILERSLVTTDTLEKSKSYKKYELQIEKEIEESIKKDEVAK